MMAARESLNSKAVVRFNPHRGFESHPLRHFLKRSNYSERCTGNALQTFQNGIGTASQSPLLNP